ncbi:MAG: hypothetical protein GKS01_16535 [Alphaproteobacteria bacterium]|nr:hypothetical protein [Alphaproteobacteria bacterium]
MICRLFRLVTLFGSLLLCGFSNPTSVTFKSAAPDLTTGKHLSIRGLLSKPGGAGPFPAIVILHTCGGVRQNLSLIWPKFLVEQGYVSLTVDSFGSRGVGNCPNEFTRTTTDKPLRPYKAIAADAHGALAYLRKLPIVKSKDVAVAGFSLGGIVIHMAILPAYAKSKPSLGFKAAISLYGNCAVRVPMEKLPDAPLPFMAIIGEKDKRILGNCQKYLPRGPNTKLHVLPGAYHAFDISFFRTMQHGFRGAPMLYNEKAAQTARKLVAEFLREHISK